MLLSFTVLLFYSSYFWFYLRDKLVISFRKFKNALLHVFQSCLFCYWGHFKRSAIMWCLFFVVFFHLYSMCCIWHVWNNSTASLHWKCMKEPQLSCWTSLSDSMKRLVALLSICAFGEYWSWILFRPFTEKRVYCLCSCSRHFRQGFCLSTPR